MHLIFLMILSVIGAEQASNDSLPAVKTVEFRAVWNHSGTGAFPGDWERSAKLLEENGFNAVLPNMLWGGSAHYASDILPRSETFKKYGDQIEQCCAAAKKHGLEVHVWKVCFNLSNAPKDFVAKLRRDGRTQVNFKGEPVDWLCPSHPENRKLELDSLLEVARKYPVAGLHLDYIRYPGTASCYCKSCRERFEKESGKKVESWPQDCHSGTRKEEYNDWRCKQITAIVAAVHDEAKQIRPEIKISAAVWGGYPDCRRSIAQDWPAWVKAGSLDFLCPMNYTEKDDYFQLLLKNQLKLVDKKIPIYPGIGATSSQSTLTGDQVQKQIRTARELGAGGFSIFNFGQKTVERMKEWRVESGEWRVVSEEWSALLVPMLRVGTHFLDAPRPRLREKFKFGWCFSDAERRNELVIHTALLSLVPCVNYQPISITTELPASFAFSMNL